MVYGRDHEDRVTHPSHYTSHPSGIECIEVTEHMSFCLGNAIKYIWRAGLKTDDAAEDLAKAVWYLEREISRISRAEDTDADKGDKDPDYAPVDWDMLRDFFDDEEDDATDDEDDEDDCGAFDCDCDGSCFEMRNGEDDEDEDAEDTYSDGRRRVTVAELRDHLSGSDSGDDTGDDPLCLLIESILHHVLTDKLTD